MEKEIINCNLRSWEIDRVAARQIIREEKKILEPVKEFEAAFLGLLFESNGFTYDYLYRLFLDEGRALAKKINRECKLIELNEYFFELKFRPLEGLNNRN